MSPPVPMNSRCAIASPTARLIVFPLVNRPRFIHRHAALAASMSPAACERHIARICANQADYYRRKGADAADVDRQVKSLEAALRVALWKYVLTPEDCA